MKRKGFFCAALVSVILGGQLSNVSVFANTDVVAPAIENQQAATEYKNTIKLRGINIDTHKDHGFDLKFDTKEMKIKVDMKRADHKIEIHPNFGSRKYIELSLYGEDGTLKNNLEIKGWHSAFHAQKFNDVSFKYGDYIKIYHEEGNDWRFDTTGDIVDGTKGKERIYRITENGLQQVFEIKNIIDIKGLPLKNKENKLEDVKFSLKFDTLDKKIKLKEVTHGGYYVHPNFGNNTYIEIKLNGESKFKLIGNDRMNKAKEFKDLSFEYGDVLEIFHKEGNSGSHRYNISGDVANKQSTTTYKYEITKNGLKQI